MQQDEQTQGEDLTSSDIVTTCANFEASFGFLDIAFFRPGVFTSSIRGLLRFRELLIK